MAENILLPSYTGITALSDLGVYALLIPTTEDMFWTWQDGINDNVFVEFDGNTYECAPQRLAAMDNAMAVGNCTNFGGTGNGEPFIVTMLSGTNTDGEGNVTNIYSWAVAALTDTAPTEHTVEVYQVEASTAFAVVLKDRSGADVTYEVPSEQIKLNTPDGTQIFTAGQAVENVPITLDLADGDQTVTAGSGQLIKSAVIQKPSTLTPDNIVKDVNIAGVVGAFEGGGSSENYEGAIIDRTISGYYFNSTATAVGNYAFCLCTKLTGVELTSASYIALGAFSSCTSLATVSVPNLSGGIGASAFYSCRSLTNVYAPKCTAVNGSAFYNCSKLSSFYAPSVKTIGERAFAYTTLVEADFPNCTSLGSSAFYSCPSLVYANFPLLSSYTINNFIFERCSKLQSVNMPLLTSTGSAMFRYCSALTTIDMPKLSYIYADAFMSCIGLTELSFSNYMTIGQSAFNSCTNLATVTFTSYCNISAYAFQRCSKLMSLYFRGSQVARLGNVNALYSTPFSVSTYTGAFGSIFVPASLVDTYKTSQYWSIYASRITAIPESEE